MNHVIIGSSSDIGQKLIDILLKEGHRVYGISRSGTAISHPDYHHRELDIVRSGKLPEDFLPEDIAGLAYLPGTIQLKPFRGTRPGQFQDEFSVNVLGAVRAIQWTLKKISEGGSIVMFSTVAVQTGMPYHTSIAASKGAVEGLSRSLAAELAPKIRVNCVAPSLTETKLSERLVSTPERREASAQRHPLRRTGQPEDIAEMAAFLLGEKSGWVTGQVFHVDGGISSLKS